MIPRASFLLRRGLSWGLALMAIVAPSGRSDAAEVPAASLFDAGVRALDEGLPQVAAFKLRTCLQSDALAPASRRPVVLALVRALLGESDAAGALTLLDTEYPLSAPPASTDDPLVTFWRAQTLAALARWPEALATYERVAESSAKDATLAAEARFGQGEAFLALDRPVEAEEAFRPLRNHPLLGPRARLRCAELALDSRHLKKDANSLLEENPAAGAGGLLEEEHAYLVGRLRLAQRQPAAARQIFSAALFGPGLTPRPRNLSERLLVDFYWGLARSFIEEDQPEGAISTLENLLEHYPNQSFLEPTFSWLENLYLRGQTHDLADLRRWIDDAAEPARGALASLTLGRVQARAGNSDRAETIFDDFGVRFPASALRVPALLDLAGLRLQLGRPDAAREALRRARLVAGDDSKWRTGVEVLAARISLAENDPAQAAEQFGEVAARLGMGPQAETAAFNAVLAALRATDTTRFNVAQADFETRFPHSALRAEFPLEEGLARAARCTPGDVDGRREAADCLRRFLAAHPDHPRAGEARLALAELAFERPHPDVPLAWRELGEAHLQTVANETGPGPGADVDRAEMLAVWLADAPGPAHDATKAIALAKRFLEQHADSPLAADVRMKLGEMYFQSGDYSDAQTQLELLVKTAPNSPLAEGALYLGGRAASLSMSTAGLDRAVELFDEAARRGGPLRLSASLRLAELKQSRLNSSQDALFLYDSVLKATEGAAALSDSELEARCAALCGKGQTLLGLAAGDAKYYREAIAVFEKLALGTPGASLAWRRQALTLKGQRARAVGRDRRGVGRVRRRAQRGRAPRAGRGADPGVDLVLPGGELRRAFAGEPVAVECGGSGLQEAGVRRRSDEIRIRKPARPLTSGALHLGVKAKAEGRVQNAACKM